MPHRDGCACFGDSVSWWGLLLGGAFGYLLGGPIGALLGAAMGRGFGRSPSSIGPEESGSERTQLAFFAAVFGVMGDVAKADGRVTPEEIGLANQVMDQLGLDARQCAAARALFDEGKRPEFPLDAVLDQLRSECGRATNLIRMMRAATERTQQIKAAWDTVRKARANTGERTAA